MLNKNIPVNLPSIEPVNDTKKYDEIDKKLDDVLEIYE